jgi:hypothetical protein
MGECDAVSQNRKSDAPISESFTLSSVIDWLSALMTTSSALPSLSALTLLMLSSLKLRPFPRSGTYPHSCRR